jgi:hypothetical protein
LYATLIATIPGSPDASGRSAGTKEEMIPEPPNRSSMPRTITSVGRRNGTIRSERAVRWPGQSYRPSKTPRG